MRYSLATVFCRCGCIESSLRMRNPEVVLVVAAVVMPHRGYEYAIGPSGHISYGAPSGYHDDCVMALALANHGRWGSENVGRMMAMSGVSRHGRVRMARRARGLAG